MTFSHRVDDWIISFLLAWRLAALARVGVRRPHLSDGLRMQPLGTAPPAYAKGPKNSVSFSNVKDGDTVPRKFTYKFEVTGYGLSPAKDGLIEGTGHHHMIIDEAGSFFPDGEAIPMDATHKHYGKAQTEGVLELEPGKHKITLQFANANHESYGKEFAKTITVDVKDSGPALASASTSSTSSSSAMDCM